MCGRYYIDPGVDLEELLKVPSARTRREGAVSRGEMCPGKDAPVLARGRAGEARLFQMRWGFPASPQSGRLVINARSETADALSLFQESAALRRCILPATAYFEWSAPGANTPKQKYRFTGADAPLLYLGGLYRLDTSGQGAQYVVLTQPAAGAAASVHGRMPLLLPKSAVKDWLSPAKDYRELLVRAENDVLAERA